MRIVIDRAKCTGHARCSIVAGDLYPLNETGHIATDGFDVEPGDELRARRGARSCPERIIQVITDEDS